MFFFLFQGYIERIFVKIKQFLFYSYLPLQTILITNIQFIMPLLIKSNKYLNKNVFDFSISLNFFISLLFMINYNLYREIQYYIIMDSKHKLLNLSRFTTVFAEKIQIYDCVYILTSKNSFIRDYVFSFQFLNIFSNISYNHKYTSLKHSF